MSLRIFRLDAHRRFFRFEEELALAVEGEGIVRGLDVRADTQCVLMDDIAVLRGEALGIRHVPVEGFKQGIEELFAELRLVVTARPEMVAVSGKGCAKLDDGIGRGHWMAAG